jgi:hypothetical protein
MAGGCQGGLGRGCSTHPAGVAKLTCGSEADVTERGRRRGRPSPGIRRTLTTPARQKRVSIAGRIDRICRNSSCHQAYRPQGECHTDRREGRVTGALQDNPVFPHLIQLRETNPPSLLRTKTLLNHSNPKVSSYTGTRGLHYKRLARISCVSAPRFPPLPRRAVCVTLVSLGPECLS